MIEGKKIKANVAYGVRFPGSAQNKDDLVLVLKDFEQCTRRGKRVTIPVLFLSNSSSLRGVYPAGTVERSFSFGTVKIPGLNRERLMVYDFLRIDDEGDDEVD